MLHASLLTERTPPTRDGTPAVDPAAPRVLGFVTAGPKCRTAFHPVLLSERIQTLFARLPGPVRRVRSLAARNGCASRCRLLRGACWATRGGLAIVMMAALPVSYAWGAGPGFRSGVLVPPRPAPEIALRAHDGSDFRLSRHRGDVVAIVFGYTFCPDVCPTTLAELAHVRKKLGPAARRLRVIFVTVDPERDSPERLRAYTQAFDRTFMGLTGSPEALAAVQKAYGVVARKRAVGGTSAAYLVDHSAFVYVVDAEGQLRLMVPFGTSIDDITHDIGLLLRS